MLMDRLPNVAVSSISDGGGIRVCQKTTQYQASSWQKNIKRLSPVQYCTKKNSKKNLQDGVGTSLGATNIVGKNKQKKTCDDFPKKILLWGGVRGAILYTILIRTMWFFQIFEDF